jgi:hypothetical protein
MSKTSRLPAVLAYIPIIGWLYVYFLQRENVSAMFHLRQSIALCLFLIGTVLLWAVVAWLLAWIPFLAILGIALFALVIAAWLFGFVALVLGLVNALRNRLAPLPGLGRWADRLPIR